MKSTGSCIVIGAGTNGLGVVRALGKEGVAVTVLDKHPKRAAMLSRYSKALQVKSLFGIDFVAELAAILREFSEPPVLFITEEAPLMAVSQYRHLVEGRCKILLPSHADLEMLMSKSGIDGLAKRYGVKVPKTGHMQSSADYELLSGFKYPCIIKPGIKDSSYAGRFKKGYRVESIAEAVDVANEVLPVLPDLVVQEWIDGGERDLYFTLVFIGEQGELIASFTGRKLRCWPLPVGGTASCGPAPEAHDQLLATTMAFFRDTGFTGMGGIEYKRDPRNGEYYMIEPTVSRTDFQHEVAVLNGVNIPYAAYCYLLDRDYNPGPALDCYAWVESVTERWSREVSGVQDSDVYGDLTKVGALYRWNDPLPWMTHIIHRLRARLAAIL